QSQSDEVVWLPRKLRNGSPISYSLYQYRNIEQTNELSSNSANNGMVCSTFLSWAHLQGASVHVSAYTYDHVRIANAANALFNAVQNACNSGVGFWAGLLRSVSCPFYNVCENAGDQVTNCMAANACATNDNNIWHGVRDDPNATATSISPDRLAGLPPHGLGPSAGATNSPCRHSCRGAAGVRPGAPREGRSLRRRRKPGDGPRAHHRRQRLFPALHRRRRSGVAGARPGLPGPRRERARPVRRRIQ